MSTMTKDPTHGTAAHGIGFGEGPGLQDRTLWDLRPDNNEGPPVKVKMAVVDAKQAVDKFPERYRYWWPGDETPERSPLTPEEIETQTHNGKIKKLEAQLAEAIATNIAANIAAQIELEHSINRGK